MKAKLGDPFLLIVMLISLGPFLTIMGLENEVQDTLRKTSELNHGEIITGMFMLVLGLTAVAVKQVHLAKRLDELERLKN